MKRVKLTKRELINEIKRLKIKINKLESSGKIIKKNIRNFNYRLNPHKPQEIEDILIKTSHDLRERVKELGCLYNVSNILNEPKLPPEKLYPKILNAIISSYQYPGITACRLQLENKKYKTNHYRHTIWNQKNPILFHGKKIGELEVCYLEKRPTIDEGPFLKEERNLITSISQILSRFIERKKVKDELQQSESRFRTLIEKAPVAISLARKGVYVYANRMFLQMFGFNNINELKGKPEIEQFAPQCRKEITKRTLLREKRVPVPDVYESVGLNRKGIQFPIHIAVARVDLAEGPASIGFFTDITERNRANADLKESREQLKNFAAHLQSVREEERVYISRELHDNLGQNLTALRIDLYRMIKKLTEENTKDNLGQFISQAEGMIYIVDSTIQLVRTIARELRPSVLDDLGLLAAIEWQIGEFIKRSGINCNLITTLKKIEIDKTHSVGVFRIIQESLTNVIRHSRATNVKIRIKENEFYTSIEIEDNGCGIKESNINSTKSLGLLGMRERAFLFGGELIIKKKKVKGTKLILTIPKIKK
jgi:PAS domain S-box-containing protein